VLASAPVSVNSLMKGSASPSSDLYEGQLLLTLLNASLMEESSQARAISSECANAVRDQNVCLGELTCAEFEAWLEEVPPDGYPCKGADDGVENACLP